MDGGQESGFIETFLTFPPDRDLALQYTGEEPCAAGHLWQGIRNQFLIHYVVRGSGRVMTADGVQSLSAGDGFLFFPGQRCWYQADDRRPWTYAWAGFAGTQADAIVRRLGFTEERTVWRAPPDPALRQRFRELARSAPAAAPQSLRLTGLLYLLLDRVGALLGPAAGSSERGQTGVIARVFRFVELHHGHDIGVSDMARHAGLERTYFSAFFKRETGTSPAAYLMAFRMARAEHLLAETGLSVKEIAFSVGYQDYFVFAKRFKKTHGCTPSGYRERAPGRARK
jgi:AraC family transcriptional regulator, arabinose operon regulatory protein